MHTHPYPISKAQRKEIAAISRKIATTPDIRVRCTSDGPGYVRGNEYPAHCHCTGDVSVWDCDNRQDTMSGGCFDRHFVIVD